MWTNARGFWEYSLIPRKAAIQAEAPVAKEQPAPAKAALKEQPVVSEKQPPKRKPKKQKATTR
jgi:hypothetical protein